MRKSEGSGVSGVPPVVSGFERDNMNSGKVTYERPGDRKKFAKSAWGGEKRME